MTITVHYLIMLSLVQYMKVVHVYLCHSIGDTLAINFTILSRPTQFSHSEITMNALTQTLLLLPFLLTNAILTGMSLIQNTCIVHIILMREVFYYYKISYPIS